MKQSEDAPKVQDLESLLKQAASESPTLRRILDTVRYGEIVFTFQDKQLVTGYIKQTIRF